MSTTARHAARNMSDFLATLQDLPGTDLLHPPDTAISGVRARWGDHEAKAGPSEDLTLIYSRLSKGDLVMTVDETRIYDGRVHGGVITVMPPGVTQCYDFRGSMENVILRVDRAVFDAVIEEEPALGGLGRIDLRAPFLRPALSRAIERQFDALRRRGPGARLLVEAAAMELSVELLLAFGEAPRRPRVAAPLGPKELLRITAYIEEAIDGAIGIKDLAAVANRPPVQFARAFKAATGETPHRFVIARRLERAKAMVLAGSEPLAEIAYACGFSSQSHMTALFSEHIGMPPGRYRKEATR
ncbi:MAG: AraC family transcriptional regulator [Pseudomonadota bacterium]